MGGRRGVENVSAWGRDSDFCSKGGKNFVLKEGGRGGTEPKKSL